MTKQEQIEEMTKERNEIKDIMKLLDKCVSLNPMYKSEVASVLYGNNYRKLPEDSVVLSREEYEMLKSLYDTQKGAIMTSSIGDLPLTIGGLRKAVDEITRLNRVETELQELTAKYYNEIERLKDDYAKLQEQFAKYQTASDKEILAQVKQAKIEVLNKLRERVETAIDTYFNLDGGGYYLAEGTLDDIDELIEEVEE